MARLLERLTGEHVLSDQCLEQLVVEKAVTLSQALALAALPDSDAPQAAVPKINRAVAIYASAPPEVLLLDDGIGVNAQKPTRQRRDGRLAPTAEPTPAPRRIITDVIMLERGDGHYQYLCEGIDAQGNTLISLEECVRWALRTEYGDAVEALNIVAISDGARSIRKRLEAIFGVPPVLILDWYHLVRQEVT